MNKGTWTKSLLIILSVFVSACTTTPTPETTASLPPVGIIRSVNLAERYVVFESEIKSTPGTQLRLLRQQKQIGLLETGTFRKRKFQSADILEGRPQPGDFAEPILPVSAEPQS